MAEAGIQELSSVVARLLQPSDGCPWCATRDSRELLTFIQSELVETALEIDTVMALKQDTLESNDTMSVGHVPEANRADSLATAKKKLTSEFGDVLFDVFLAAGLASRDGLGVSLDNAASLAVEKIRRRCPYIFGGETLQEKKGTIATTEGNANTSQAALAASVVWNRVKSEEKSAEVGETINHGAEEGGVSKSICSVPRDVIILVAKFPTRGKSKTRLMPALGEEGTLAIARALVSDALYSVGTAPELKAATKVLLFAPESSRSDFQRLLQDLGLDAATWVLIPMQQGDDLRSSDLGGKLAFGLKDARAVPSASFGGDGKMVAGLSRGAALFIGMDAPEVSPLQIAQALATARSRGSAYICPATDGGYTLLALPPGAPDTVFSGVRWSADDTCLSQMSQIASKGIPVLVGPTYDDIDDIHDLRGLSQRLRRQQLSCVPGELNESAPASTSRIFSALATVLPNDDPPGESGQKDSRLEATIPVKHTSLVALPAFLTGACVMAMALLVISRKRPE